MYNPANGICKHADKHLACFIVGNALSDASSHLPTWSDLYFVLATMNSVVIPIVSQICASVFLLINARTTISFIFHPDSY